MASGMDGELAVRGSWIKRVSVDFVAIKCRILGRKGKEFDIQPICVSRSNIIHDLSKQTASHST